MCRSVKGSSMSSGWSLVWPGLGGGVGGLLFGGMD
jgi:hypothetical protein